MFKYFRSKIVNDDITSKWLIKSFVFQLLERVVRSQRLGSELATAVKRQVLRVKKPKAAVIAEYTQAKALNDSLKNIVATLSKEYPNLGDKLEIISNTLDIYSPTQSPRLSEDQCVCPNDLGNIAEKPFECPCPI